MTKALESLEIKIQRTAKPRETWGPFSGLYELRHAGLPLGEDSSWRVIVRANKGYGKNHDSGMTAISTFRGELDLSHLDWTVNASLAGYGVSKERFLCPEKIADWSKDQ